jgi:outer membrane protein assembly factor BamE (lipoprotein component of BamABCDE complex)
MVRKACAMAVVGLSLAGCMGAQEHRARVVNTDADRVTVGTVQREIKVGMSGADVVAALGSPNVVTSDELRRENWVYDKISTDTVESRSSGGASILILGAGSDAGARSTTQRTLTIVIKFDENKLVRDFAYRQSSF